MRQTLDEAVKKLTALIGTEDCVFLDVPSDQSNEHHTHILYARIATDKQDFWDHPKAEIGCVAYYKESS